MRIGLDLDNTLIDYDAAFRSAVAELGAIDVAAHAGKRALRDALRAQPGGEAQWMRVQAEVYGSGIERARLYPGVEAFIAAARARDIVLTIVSHKSAFAAAAPDGPNLRDAATAFLRARGIELPIAFAATRAGKCRRLAELGVTHAIDDLAEVFSDPAFPPGVVRWLFAPHGQGAGRHVDRIFNDWDELRQTIAP